MADPGKKIDSRKWQAFFWATGLITAVGIMSGWVPGIQPSYTTLVGGIVSVYGLYCGINVAQKFAAGMVEARRQTKAPKKAGDPANQEDG